jgi:hypothetical protein
LTKTGECCAAPRILTRESAGFYVVFWVDRHWDPLIHDKSLIPDDI